MNDYIQHELGKIIPQANQHDYEILERDIKENGLKVPITLYEGSILDGWSRYRICNVNSIQIKTEEYKGTSPLSYILSLNVHRRHLKMGQLAMMSTELLPMLTEEANKRQSTTQLGGITFESGSLGPARDLASQLFNVNPRYVSDAYKIKLKSPETAERVKTGELSLADAMMIIKRLEYNERLNEAEKNPQNINFPGPYEIIVSDPPWLYGAPIREHTHGVSLPQDYYNCIPLEEIIKHKPLSADNSILFLWATVPLLPEALEVMKAWGFKYSSNCIWNKVRSGLGFWFLNQHETILIGTKGNNTVINNYDFGNESLVIDNQHEHLLVGVKGSPGIPPTFTRTKSIFVEQRTRHSAKPKCFMEWVEKSYPGKTKLEMYCRSPRPGWSVFGNEV
jgi:N6-adenosine-specific RNA methylase IME4